MPNKLQEHFPMIRDRDEVRSLIQNSPSLSAVFHSWKYSDQEHFLDYCTGVRGFKLLYDSFFKEIFNPDVSKERLEHLLSLILNTQIRILKVLPNDAARIAAESSLLVMDIVVELEDGSIANVEMRKIGYAFPGHLHSPLYSPVRFRSPVKSSSGICLHCS